MEMTPWYGVVDEDEPMIADKAYAERRKMIESLNDGYKMGQQIATVKYTDLELQTWQVIWDVLMPNIYGNACKIFTDNMDNFKEVGLFSRNHIPQ